MSITGRFFITPHAVERYRTRIRRGLSYDEALSELIGLAAAGRRVRAYEAPGLVHAELWRGPRMGSQGDRDPRSRLRFVVGFMPGGLPQVVTVLPVGKSATCVTDR